MSLDTYNSWDEKKRLFRHHVVNSFDEFHNLVKNFEPKILRKSIYGMEFVKERRFLFRGVNDSSFMMFSSLQRCYDGIITEGLKAGKSIEELNGELSLKSLRESILQRFKSENNSFLYRHYKQQSPEGTISTQPSMWAFIQHFGGPSPLLDFTSDMESSLFFAFDRIKPAQPGNIMSEYVSLYIFPDNPMRTGEVGGMWANDMDAVTQSVIDHEMNNPGERVDTDEFLVEASEQPLEQETWGSMVYGGEKSRYSYRIPDYDNSTVSSAVDNVNISAQMGNFFQGNIEEMLPLESAPSLRKAYCDGIFGDCIEINKSIVEEIRNHYHVPTEAEVYPEKNGRLKPLYDAMKDLWNYPLSQGEK